MGIHKKRKWHVNGISGVATVLSLLDFVFECDQKLLDNLQASATRLVHCGCKKRGVIQKTGGGNGENSVEGKSAQEEALKVKKNLFIFWCIIFRVHLLFLKSLPTFWY